MKVMRSGRQTARRLIIFRRTCTPAILLWAYLYAGPSNFGRFGQIFLAYNTPVRPLTEALLTALLHILSINPIINQFNSNLAAQEPDSK